MHSKALASAEQLSILRPILMALVLAAVLGPFAAPAHAELNDRLTVLAGATAVHVRPGTHEPVVMQVQRGRALLEFQRLGPGTHHIIAEDFSEQTVEIAAGDGEWVHVGVLKSDAKSGWVRAADVALNYRAEISERVIDPCLRAALRARGVDLDVSVLLSFHLRVAPARSRE